MPLTKMKQRSILWKFYEKVPGKLYVARCLVCQKEYRYSSTTSNLKKHLANKHAVTFKNCETVEKSDNSINIVYTEYEEGDNSQFSFVGEEVEVQGTSEDESTDLPILSNLKQEDIENSDQKRKNHSAVWSHFVKLPHKDKIAKCLYCGQEYSYKSSGSNLKRHLNMKHTSVLNNSNEQKKKLSAVWNHFLKLADKDRIAQCLHCGKENSYKSTAGNLKRHLKFKHKSVYYSLFHDTENSVRDASGQKYEDPLSPHTSEEDDEKLVELPKPLKTRRDSSSDGQVTPLSKQLIRPREPMLQHKVNPIRLRVPQDSKLIIDKKLLEMIIQDQETFSLVEGQGFRNFVQSLNPHYELPTRKMISSTLVPEKFKECKSHVMNLIQNANNLCITIDSWISRVKDTYIALTAHFILDYKLNSVMLHCENLSASYTIDTVAKLLKDIAHEYDIEDKITLVVSQNAHYLKEAVEQNEWPYFVCFIQKINLVIEMSIGVIDPIVAKVKRIVVYFKNNVEVTQALLKYQTDIENKTLPLRLILSVSSRWNSVFYMLQRFLNLQNAVTSVLEDLTVDLPDISAEMWGTIKQVCMILQPLEEATRAMCGAPYLTASLAIVIVDGLKNVIELMKNKPLTGVAKNFFVNVESCLKIYLLNAEIEDNLLLGVCTFLDPRFKIHAFLDHDSEQDSRTCETSQRMKRAYVIKNHVLELLKHKLKEKQQIIRNSNNESDMSQIILIIEEPEPISIWGKINKTIAASTPSQDDISAKAKKELEMFLNEEVVWRGSCPQEWWKNHEMIYPNLAEIYAEHSHIVVTSVQCERAFSKTGDILDEKRARLSRKRTPELVFLNSNSHVFN